MTRRIARPAEGVLHADQGLDRIDLLTEGGRQTFFDAANGSGLTEPTGNVLALLQGSDGAVYAGDGDSDAVYRLHDLTGDGDAQDPGEATVWLDETAGFTLPTPNGLGLGPDGAIYVVNAGVASRPADAIYRTEDLNGDGDALDEGEARVWLDLSLVSPTSSPFEMRFDGEVAYLLDPNGAGQDVVWRIEDADGSGDIQASEVGVFLGSDMDFGAPIDFAFGGTGADGYLWQWLADGDAPHRLVRLRDLDGSGTIDAPAEAAEVWTSAALPEGFDAAVGFSVAAAPDGRVALTSNGAEPGQRFVAVLTDRDGDGDFADAGETEVAGSALGEPDAFDRPRTVEFYQSPAALPFLPVAGGGNHYSLFLADGTPFAAGENLFGQLGQGVTGFDVPAPLAVEAPDEAAPVVAVSAGLIHAAFLDAEGDVWSWGFGNSGRLGLGDEETRTVPEKIAGALDERDVALVELGNGASYAITEDGALWAWGQNTNGQLGLGDREERLVPTRVEAVEDAVAVSSGTSHTLALTAEGEVLAWGSNSQGQLGSPAGLDEGEPVRRVLEPVAVEGLPEGVRVAAITADTNTSYAVLEDGRVFGWGEGSFGQLLRGERLGDGAFMPSEEDALAPVELVELPPEVIDVAGGARWAAALTAEGEVWLWGPDDEGPTGGLDGDPSDEEDVSFLPTRLEALAGERVVEIATGPNHLIAVTEDGRFLTFGSNPDGRLGYPTDGPTDAPREVPIGEDAPPLLLAAEPADGARNVAPTADLALIFTEPVTVGEGVVRLTDREDPANVIEAPIAGAEVEGTVVTIDLPGLLRPGARYDVTLDEGLVRDEAGRAFPGLAEPGVYDLTVDPDARVLIGGDGFDRLVGSEASEAIATGAGRLDIAKGGGGADVFVFGAETSNDVREVDVIRDFGPDDALDLGGTEVASEREIGRLTILRLEGDGDLVLLWGAPPAEDVALV